MFAEHGERLASSEITAALNALPDRPWRTWNGRGLTPRAFGLLLEPLGIRPRQLKRGGEKIRGYRHADIAPFTRPRRHARRGDGETGTRPEGQ